MKERKYFIFILLFLLFLKGFAQVVDYPFADEIRQFKENDRLNPPPRHAIFFVGSSSFTLWKDVQDYFPEYTIVNRGFGGSTLIDQIRYADDIIFPFSPRQIVIYCGENDLAYSDTVTSEMVTERFKTLFKVIRSKLPDVRITYVSMKPSPSRWHLARKFIDGNQGIRQFLESQPNTGFVNIWDSMLKEDHRPDPALFLEDSLHMNANGYRIWQKAIRLELIN
jgi:lysophospholipase L1-like esterase